MIASHEDLTYRRCSPPAASITAPRLSPPAASSRSIRRAIWPRSPATCWPTRGSAGFRSPTIRAAGRCFRPTGSAGLVADRRGRVVLHLTCKDMNRNGLEAAAWRYASEGFENILAITGDYPTGGFGGLAEPVFDLDSVSLITLLQSMNDGLSVPGPRRQARNAAENQLLHRLRRLAVQAPRAGTGAAVFQAGPQDRRRRPVGHSAIRLRHAEVPRGEAVPRSPRHQRARDRQRLSA